MSVIRSQRPLQPPARLFLREEYLFAALALPASVAWFFATYWSDGWIWAALPPAALLLHCLRQALTSHLEGNGVRITTRQYPDLHVRLERCCRKLGLARVPRTYLIHGWSRLHSLAWRLLRHRQVMLRAELVDALDSDVDAVDFYLGRELSHLARPHAGYGWWILPALPLPLLGSAYRRAKEYTADRCGTLCCRSLHSSIRALALLAAGPRRWQNLDAHAFVDQAAHSGGFWMSLQELTATAPWLCKRMARLPSPPMAVPRRHLLAWPVAAVLPAVGGGGFLANLATLGVLGLSLMLVALPAYEDYRHSTVYHPLFSYAHNLAQAAKIRYEAEHTLTATPAELGFGRLPLGIARVHMDEENGRITLGLTEGSNIVYYPYLDTAARIVWRCTTTLPRQHIPWDSRCNSSSEDGSAPIAWLRQLARL